MSTEYKGIQKLFFMLTLNALLFIPLIFLKSTPISLENPFSNSLAHIS